MFVMPPNTEDEMIEVEDEPTAEERLKREIEDGDLDYVLSYQCAPEGMGLHPQDKLWQLWKAYLKARDEITDYLEIHC